MFATKTEPLCQKIAERIKALRLRFGWKLNTLAKKTGFSKSYLSEIENGKKEPPISSLTKIAYALGIDVVTLITGGSLEPENKPFILVRSDERRPVAPLQGAETFKFESLTYKRPNKLMNAYLLTASFEFPENPLTHAGEEFLFMLEGKQEVFYDGQTYFIQKGDCIYLDSNRPHYGRSVGKTPAKFIVVSCVEKNK
jgi:transcriptional regulator with XRE-family HTH domain